MIAPRWDAIIDEFAFRLERQRTALDSDAPDRVPPFVPPTDLGPLPGRLRHRAETLLQESAALERDLATRMDAVGRELAVVRRFGGPAHTSASAFVDHEL